MCTGLLRGSSRVVVGAGGSVVARVAARFACEHGGTYSSMRVCLITTNKQLNTTFNNGSLGSCNDEERSEMRNVMRFAPPVSHRVFERTWHPLGLPAGIPV